MRNSQTTTYATKMAKYGTIAIALCLTFTSGVKLGTSKKPKDTGLVYTPGGYEAMKAETKVPYLEEPKKLSGPGYATALIFSKWANSIAWEAYRPRRLGPNPAVENKRVSILGYGYPKNSYSQPQNK